MTINVKKHVEITDDMVYEIAQGIYESLYCDTEESLAQIILGVLGVDYDDEDEAEHIYFDSLDSEEEEKQILDMAKKKYLKIAMEEAEDNWDYFFAG